MAPMHTKDTRQTLVLILLAVVCISQIAVLYKVGFFQDTNKHLVKRQSGVESSEGKYVVETPTYIVLTKAELKEVVYEAMSKISKEEANRLAGGSVVTPSEFSWPAEELEKRRGRFEDSVAAVFSRGRVTKRDIQELLSNYSDLDSHSQSEKAESLASIFKNGSIQILLNDN